MRHLNPKLVMDRLRDKCKLFREIGGSGDLAQALKDVRAVPAVYVVPSTERSASVLSGSAVRRQRATCEFTLVVITKNYTSKIAHAADGLQACLESIAAALDNWVPTLDATGCRWSQGSMYDYRGDQVIWEDRWSTDVSNTRGVNP